MQETTADIEVLGDLDVERGMLVAAVAPDNDLVHISEEDAKRRRDLVCPACRTGVIAVKGPVHAHHFRHRSRADCLSGAETALHLLAKRALEERPELVLPRILVTTDRVSREIRPPRLARLSCVALERHEGAVRPDVYAVAEGARLYVEIRVSHRVDEAKRERLRARGVSTIEIDLSRLRCDANLDQVAEAIRRAAPRDWVWSRLAEQTRARLLAEERAEAARRAARLEAKAEAALRAFQAPAPAPDPPGHSRRLRRIARLGLALALRPGRADAALAARPEVWRAFVIDRFLLDPCGEVAPSGVFRLQLRQGPAGWTGYPPAQFTTAEIVDALRGAMLLAPPLADADAAVAEAARRREDGFLSGQEAVALLLEELQDADLVVEQQGLSVSSRFGPSDKLLGRVWREKALGRLAGVVRRTLVIGELDEEAVEDWLDGRAKQEICGETRGESLLPMLKTLADIVLAFERSGRAATEPPPASVVEAAARLGLVEQGEGRP